MFGDLNDPESEVVAAVASRRAARKLLEDLGTLPKVTYLAAADAGMSEASVAQARRDDLLRPLLQTSWRFYALVAFLGSIVADGPRHLGLPDVHTASA